MQPTNIDLLGQRAQESSRREQAQRSLHGIHSGINMSSTDSRRLYSEESWVDVTSRPSSSSLSSAATDEIVTTGLRVQQPHPPRRRRRNRPSNSTSQGASSLRRNASNGSSQEEYDESESEEDHVMTSSTENISEGSSQPRISPGCEVDHRDSTNIVEDDNATALGVSIGNNVFTPQPHAFSHHTSPAPMSENARRSAPNSYFPPPMPNTTRRNSSSRPRNLDRQTSAPSSHSHPAIDHDAALRASLSTLLSCAAAARGLPKPASTIRHQSSPIQNSSSTRPGPGPLRIVPASALLSSSPNHQSPTIVTQSRQRRASSSSNVSITNVKRKAVSPTRARAKKSKRTSTAGNSSIPRTTSDSIDDYYSPSLLVSPTLFAWLVSASVVVLVSAIGFSAGYAIGRDVGRAEAEAAAAAGFGGSVSAAADAIGSGAGGCGKEAVKGGLRRFRWAGTGAGGVRA